MDGNGRFTPERAREYGLKSKTKFTRRRAILAGRKGGLTVSQDREHMAMIGRRGGESRAMKIGTK